MTYSRIAAACLFAGVVCAQTRTDARWIALDTAKPGTPAEVRLDRIGSDAGKTTLNIVVHGFYLEPRTGPDGAYQKIIVPGMGSFAPVGYPDLPAVRFAVGVVTDVKATRLAGVRAPQGVKKFDGINVFPRTIGERDHEKGHGEEFRKDESAYKLPTPFPAEDGPSSTPVKPVLGNLMGARHELYPFKWDAGSRQLIVSPVLQVIIDHSGTPKRHQVTRHRNKLAAATFINHAAIEGSILVNAIFYEGDFLFIYPAGYKDELQPLINQKKARGFRTTEYTTTTTGKTCAGIRTQIQAWYNSRLAHTDKYALLVGDTDQIPLCTGPGSRPTDDLYGSVDGDDLDEEIFVGRLSVDSEADLTNQVTKILNYEDSPAWFCCYDRALLVAHKENAPGKYVGAHESVRTAAYAVPPSFTALYGHNAGVDDADVSLAINNGVGLVAYRGHGDEWAWTTWNIPGESYNSGDVTGLANLMDQAPVVWSFACTNAALDTNDAIGEVWMKDADNRAVSFYGATVPSWTIPNHELDRQMFKAVYDTGLTIQSHAIKQAEDQMFALEGAGGADNAWMYLLLGDPEMTIRRRNPLDWKIQIPVEYKPCYGPGCYLQISIFDKYGNPAPYVKVSAWKRALDGRDEVLSNRYSDAKGTAQVPVSGVTAGKMLVSFSDDAGNVTTRTVVIR